MVQGYIPESCRSPNLQSCGSVINIQFSKLQPHFLPALYLAAIFVFLSIHLEGFIHVFQGVGPLYGKLSRVHFGQGALFWVEPGLLVGSVLPLPFWILLSCLMHTLQDLKMNRLLSLRIIPHLHSQSINLKKSTW